MVVTSLEEPEYTCIDTISRGTYAVVVRALSSELYSFVQGILVEPN